MEYVPHNYLCQTLYLDKLSRSIIHRTVNRLLGVENDLHEHLDGLQLLVCSEPFVWCPWIEEFGRNIVHRSTFLRRLKKEMCSNNQILACQAICTLNELVHHPELAVEATRIKIIPRFVKPLSSDNLITMQRSLLCLKHLSMQPMGIASILENSGIVLRIRDCIRHPTSPIIRCQAAITVNALVHNYFAVHTLTKYGYVKTIMKCVNETKDFNLLEPIVYSSLIEMKQLMVNHLDSLLRLLDDGDSAKVALMSEGVFNLSCFLTGECVRLKKAVASLFVEIAKHPIGKTGIVSHGLIPLLCKEMATAHDKGIKSKLTSVLQFATIHKEGRKQALECGLIETLVKLLPLSNVSLDLKKYVINTLTNLAELPEGRKSLRNMLGDANVTILIHFEHDASIIRSIKNLYNVINWEP
ncbi:unnamed protein product [Nezara viridula]|uniref:Uncharacterized protein n=1 Tax=Nezara viridula TaxID=85310 RepID=A0A9P0GWP5_NEZVI|nr:unnamed protein product [Nezara viridula]